MAWAGVGLNCQVRWGQIGINPDFLPHGMLVIANGVSSQLVVFHQASSTWSITFHRFVARYRQRYLGHVLTHWP